MTITLDLDPTIVRQRLERHRAKGAPWQEAWLEAVDYRKASAHDRSLYKFMHDHFKAAYLDDGTRNGRCLVPERDTSGAIVKGMLKPAPVAAASTCRSGDGCERPAVRGRFGPTFCEYHGAELERIRQRPYPQDDVSNGRSPVARCG